MKSSFSGRLPAISCKVCGADSFAFDVVDFTRNCEEAKGGRLPLSGVAIYYYGCPECGFLFTPAFDQWDEEDFKRYIYNSEYSEVDPDYQDIRPGLNHNFVTSIFGKTAGLSVLDYGGGEGKLCSLLRADGWDAHFFDPYMSETSAITEVGQVDIILAFEVFEHVVDLQRLLNDIDRFAGEETLVLFSTSLSDGFIQPGQRINWCYVAPRNGHVSIFSQNSLKYLLATRGWQLAHFNAGFHLAFRNIPDWAKYIFPEQ